MPGSGATRDADVTVAAADRRLVYVPGQRIGNYSLISGERSSD